MGERKGSRKGRGEEKGGRKDNVACHNQLKRTHTHLPPQSSAAVPRGENTIPHPITSPSVQLGPNGSP